MSAHTTAVGSLRIPEASARPVSLWRTPRTRALLVLGTVGFAAAVVIVLARVYADVLWFRELGQESAYWTTLKWQVMAEGVVALGTASFLLANFAVVDWAMTRHAGAAVTRAPFAPFWRYRRLVYPVVAILCGAASRARWPDVGWQHLLLWSHRTDFGVEDPLFHRDIGFFVFSLPLYRELSTWLLETLVMAGLASLVAYTIAGGLRIARPVAMARVARAHMLVLAGLLLVVVAWRLRLDQFSLTVPGSGGPLPGATYTDVRVRLPALKVLTGLALLGAAVTFYAAFRRLPFRSYAVMAAIAVAAIGAMSYLPSVFERFGVQPQELTRERPYVDMAITATRSAYDLDRVQVRELAGDRQVSRADLETNRQILENVPLWDGDVLRSAMNELEAIGSYYSFGEPTVDRYTINGVPRVTTLAARQLDLSRLDLSARSWANQRFAYTHGYGVVAVRAAATDSQQFPLFQQREFAAQPNPLHLEQPRIYYSEKPASKAPYLITPSTRGEVEEPAPGSSASKYHYDGSGGIPLPNRLRVAAFAARFGDLKLLLSRTVTSDSRIVLHRDVRDRVQTLAPFLHWEADAQTAVVGGRVTYIFHGYTTSNDYPYSASVDLGRNRVNYIREAARATVDSFSGHVSIYAAESADPILRAWESAYPDLFLPAARMPSELRAHLRYPQELFVAQTKIYATYHAGDATAFWTGADAWERPFQLSGPVEEAGEVRFPDPEQKVDSDEREEGTVSLDQWRMQPQYLFARLPGSSSQRFVLATPYTPRGRQNLSGYLAGTIENGRPTLRLMSLPRDRLTIGPAQATRRILANPAVTRRLELLNKESRDLGKAAVLRTLLGATRVLPLGDQLVHIQPVYLSAAGDGVPRLQLVAVYANGRVGYGRTLEAALKRAVPSA